MPSSVEKIPMDHEASPNLLTEIVKRLVHLEETVDLVHGQVTKLQAQVAQLECRVTTLGKGLMTLDDRSDVPGTTISPTLFASKHGLTSMLATRLEQGADPNQHDGHEGTCLVASACYARPECIRHLLNHGADAMHVYSGDNASILYMLALKFQDDRREEDSYREGDYVLSADMLVNAARSSD